MSLVETLHRQKEERRRRFVEASLEYERKKAAIETIEQKAKPIVPAAPVYVLDQDYENAWAFEIMGFRDEGPPALVDILKAVAKSFNVKRYDMMSARRTADLVLPRQVFCYLAKKLTLHSLPAIGRVLGSRNHTTILYSARKMEREIANDENLRAIVEKIKRDVGGVEQIQRRVARYPLSDAAVRNIRAWKGSIKDIAARYQVPVDVCWHIRRGDTWRHVK